VWEKRREKKSEKKSSEKSIKGRSYNNSESQLSSLTGKGRKKENI
jgi:hypothetical protein